MQPAAKTTPPRGLGDAQSCFEKNDDESTSGDRTRRRNAGRRWKRANLHQLRRGLFFRHHVRRWNTGACKGFFAVLRRRPAHVPFHVCQSRAARAAAGMRARGTSRQIFQPDRPHIVHFLGMAPDIRKPLFPDIARRKRELDAGKNLAVWRYIAGSMPGAAWSRIQFIFAGGGGNRTKFVDIAYQRRIPENLPQ